MAGKLLKPYWDAVQAAEGEVQKVKREMLAEFNKNTPAGNRAALAMRGRLEAAEATALEKRIAYNAARDEKWPDQGQTNNGLLMRPNSSWKLTREEFERLDPQSRMDFCLAGGKLVD